MNITKDELLKKLGLENSDKETQDEILNELADTVNLRIMNKVEERLSDEDLEELERLMNNNDEGAVEWFIKSKFEHYDNFAAQVEEETINEIINNFEAMKAGYEGREGPKPKLDLE